MEKEMQASQETARFITLYHKQHWGGMTLKRLRIGFYKWYMPFWEWQSGGRVTRKPIFCNPLSKT